MKEFNSLFNLRNISAEDLANLEPHINVRHNLAWQAFNCLVQYRPALAVLEEQFICRSIPQALEFKAVIRAELYLGSPHPNSFQATIYVDDEAITSETHLYTEPPHHCIIGFEPLSGPDIPSYFWGQLEPASIVYKDGVLKEFRVTIELAKE